MSRIGNKPIQVPEKVKIRVEGQSIFVEGPKGKLQMTAHQRIKVLSEDKNIVVKRQSEAREDRALHGTTRSIIANLIKGVNEGYKRELEIKGVGFRAALQGKILNLSLGKSHPILFPIPEGIKITVTENTNLTIEGIDKHLVGQVTANIINYYRPEPYKGKGVHEKGKQYLRKEGKTAQSK
jgi:large subunit ribosomal protein L6